ncbi:sensor histidine kinase [Parahaliea mediterranea]|uniref:sensor histidine kinase n=1 Tax=Parahaliea mediterranea TaxID=651086 RepID=UPI001F4E56C2|nr:HAMP domain-containing sensor histidine kinase [Parahaliea mediterranea]
MNRPAILTNPLNHSSNRQNTTLFRIYVAYRSLLSVVLLVMLISPNTRQLVGGVNPSLYLFVSIAYVATSVVLMGSLSASWHLNRRFLFLVFLVDIGAIILLSDASGGMISGLPVLLVITVAASAVMISHRTLATLVAALAVLAILLDTVRLISIGKLDINALFPAGLLGLLLFGVSVLVQGIALRLGRAEELARTRASDLYNLQRLNEQIVQHMQTGILLVAGDGRVRVMNKAASTLLAPERPVAVEQGRQLAEYSEDLALQYAHWRDSGLHRAQPFQVQEGAPPVIAHFRELQPGNDGEALIFVEDYTPVTQYAQALKLTSLGRLTASIAHEIRNPLGAISHAAQLLRESPSLDTSDQRLADIIQENSLRVNQIVESVMQISRREPPKPEYLLLADWLAKFIGDYLDTLNRPASVTVNCPYRDLLVEFDPENLRRVLGNLLDNALRHSRMATGSECAHIEVALDFQTTQCFIDVIDEGHGVPPGDRGKLFEPFFTTVESGSGMGLYLCKELCEINNAALNYQPTDSGASRFRLALNKRAL